MLKCKRIGEKLKLSIIKVADVFLWDKIQFYFKQ